MSRASFCNLLRPVQDFLSSAEDGDELQSPCSHRSSSWHQSAVKLGRTFGVDRAGVWHVSISLGICLTGHVTDTQKRDTNQPIFLDCWMQMPGGTPRAQPCHPAMEQTQQL